ncbi:uncharacterized protein A4U43_C03F18030 [Asparagus officinalis]|uniref:Uncharacterized protein n=1 Tax=Asparagus officinalis TaxID=4686 RepID=A0A5P1FAY6_ASPOF|nr:uncharacterized protein A4U43_C03F18030 [Asparagus officinalis]
MWSPLLAFFLTLLALLLAFSKPGGGSVVETCSVDSEELTWMARSAMGGRIESSSRLGKAALSAAHDSLEILIEIPLKETKELDPENCDEFDLFVKSHKRKRGLGDYPHEDTKDVCEKVIERVEELKIQLQNADPATKAHRLKLSAILDEVAGKHHGGYERGYGAGYKGRTIAHHFSASYNIEGNVNNNSELQEQLHSANQKIEELQKRADEAEREKEREREERDRQMQDFQKMASGFQAMIGLNGQAQ